jgi:hypothetical protein
MEIQDRAGQREQVITGQEIFLFLKTATVVLPVKLHLLFNGYRVFSGRKGLSGLHVMLTTHFHLVPMSMSGSILLYFLYASMVRTGENFSV